MHLSSLPPCWMPQSKDLNDTHCDEQEDCKYGKFSARSSSVNKRVFNL